jgi:hypothetical protein
MEFFKAWTLLMIFIQVLIISFNTTVMRVNGYHTNSLIEKCTK